MPGDEVGPRSRRVEPLLQLAVDVGDGGFKAWLDEVAEPVPGGWLAPGGSADNLEQDVAALRAALLRMALPRPFAEVWQAAGLDAARAETALAMVADYRVRGSYIHQGHLGAKARRLARLHELALAGASGNIIDAWHLAALDASAGHEDELSPRMVQLQLAEGSHLFARLFDQYWVVLPTAAAWSGGPEAIPAPAREDLAPRFDSGSLSSWVYETLRREGPMRHVDLRDQAVLQVAGVSASSVGPMLLMHPVFHRIAPGVFDIRRDAPATSAIPSSLLSAGQCRTYARARKSGAPQDYFSGWTGEFEWRLCEWARTEADGEVFRSLLSISDPAGWPAPETVRTEWRRLKQLYGRWSLGTERLQALGSEPPSPAEFFAGVVHVAAFGSIGWIGAGRVTQARLGSQGGADLLALLVAAGCAESPADWQSAHDATASAGRVADALSAALHETGRLDWNALPLAALLDEAAANASRVRWADSAEVQALAGALRGVQTRHPAAAAGPVLEEVEDLFASEEWEQLFTD